MPAIAVDVTDMTAAAAATAAEVVRMFFRVWGGSVRGSCSPPLGLAVMFLVACREALSAASR